MDFLSYVMIPGYVFGAVCLADFKQDYANATQLISMKLGGRM